MDTAATPVSIRVDNFMMELLGCVIGGGLLEIIRLLIYLRLQLCIVVFADGFVSCCTTCLDLGVML